jgi:hypothetical protein
MMNVWDKLAQVNIEDKEKFQRLFSLIISKVKTGSFSVEVGEAEYEDYFLVVEENRLDSYFIHIVPKQIYSLFKEMQASVKEQFLGFSVTAGQYGEKPVRVSCFGVPCNLLGKSLFQNP